MSTIGSIIAGLAVAVGGVMIGRKLEQARAELGGKKKPASMNSKPSKIIDAKQDPETGIYKSTVKK